MSLYCDVALPVPLDREFTYALGGRVAVVGARVLVPFSGQRLVGVVLRVHGDAPAADVDVKAVESVLDDAPLLTADLLALARWIADYYVAPVGEVLRGMLPLTAEVRRHFTYRIAEAGRRVLLEGAARGSSRRSRLSADEQNREYAALNYLEDGEPAKLPAIRTATGANKALLDAMARKKWLVREAVAEQRDARRLEQVAVLVEDAPGTLAPVEKGIQAPVADSGKQANDDSQRGRRLPALTANQLAVMAELAGAGGALRLAELRERLRTAGAAESSIVTLVRRGLIALRTEAEAFAVSGLRSPDGKKHAHEHTLNEAQTEALASIVAAMQQGEGNVADSADAGRAADAAATARSGAFAPLLLYGVTGSGKTAVYIAAMRRALDAGRGVLLLVPEIGLTPSMATSLVAAFGAEVALLHSQLTPDERAEQWHRIRRGDARVVVGTRSAVFAPVARLGLILVDEEHDASYKQEETPRYHARDCAVMRAKLLSDAAAAANEPACVVVLGSATPSLESWANAERGRYRLLTMTERVAARPLPAVELIDMREEFRQTGADGIFSRALLAETQATLDRGEQAIVLLNRRGYSFVVMCRSCGEKIQCENCAVAVTYHKAGHLTATGDIAEAGERLQCHLCGYKRNVPQTCPACGGEHLFFFGAGSQQGEERLGELFPGARIGRMDRDTVRTRGDMERLLSRLHTGEINLLVGTQMIAKGHDIHGVTLVGVVGADFALNLPDFRSAERVFQLITQVSGRAGRGKLPGRVLVQSYQPEHYVNRFAACHDFTGFAAKEMYLRRATRYPPFSVLANVLVQSERLEEAMAWSTELARWFAQAQPRGVRLLGPAAAPVARIKRVFRYHVILRAERRDALTGTLRAMLRAAEQRGVPRRSLTVDVDPVHLM